MSNPNNPAELLRSMSLEQLDALLKDTYKELFKLRIQLSTGQLLTNHQVGSTRRKIARILTIMTQKKKVGNA